MHPYTSHNPVSAKKANICNRNGAPRRFISLRRFNRNPFLHPDSYALAPAAAAERKPVREDRFPIGNRGTDSIMAKIFYIDESGCGVDKFRATSDRRKCITASRIAARGGRGAQGNTLGPVRCFREFGLDFENAHFRFEG